MGETLKIKKIEKYEEQLNDNLKKTIKETKFLAFWGLLIFVSAKDGCDSELEQLLMAGGVLFGTIDIMSLVKSICKIYNLKERIKNENKQK